MSECCGMTIIDADGHQTYPATDATGAAKFSAYEDEGLQVVNEAPTVLSLDTQKINTDNDVFELADDVLTINRNGDVEIDYRTAIGSVGFLPFSFEVWLEYEAPGSDRFDEIVDSRLYSGQGAA